MGRSALREVVDRMLSGVEFLPIFTALTVAENDALWLTLFTPPGEVGQRWLVVNLGDDTAMHVSIPFNAQLLAATADRVVLLRRDSDGVEEVSLHEILNTSAGN
jgi:hypothetical protein